MTVGRETSGFLEMSISFLITKVNLGSNAANPPWGSLGDPVTNIKNFLLSIVSISVINLIKLTYSADF